MEESLVEKNFTDEEELDGIKIDGILNFENLPRTVFIILKLPLMEESLLEHY